MIDESDDDAPFEPTEEMTEAGATWVNACLGQVEAEIAHAKEQNPETAEALQEASEEVDAATNTMLDLIREQLNAEDVPYRGPFRP